MRFGTSASFSPMCCSSSRMYGFTTALPLSNIGRFCASRIWMRRPSGVMSRRICERIDASFWLVASASSTFDFSASRRSPLGALLLGLQRLQVDGLARRRDVALLDLADRARQIGAAAAHDVRRVARAAAADERDLERRIEEVGDALAVALGRSSRAATSAGRTPSSR
jgi:hypothetical protein